MQSNSATAAAALRELVHGFSIVLFTGPRHAGKTTLVKITFPGKPYASLEDPDVREFASCRGGRWLIRA